MAPTINVVSNTKQDLAHTYFHNLFNHGNPDKIHRTFAVTDGYKQPDKPFEACFCEACARGNQQVKALKHPTYMCICMAKSSVGCNVSTPSATIGPPSNAVGDQSVDELSDDDEDIDCTEDSDGDYDSDNSSYKYDMDSGSDAEECYEINLQDLRATRTELDSDDSDVEDDAFDLTEFQLYEAEGSFKAQTPGQVTSHAVPHFNIKKLKPWEVFFADGKDYDCTQHGGIDMSLIILELKSNAWFKVDCQRKLQYGKAIRTLMICEGVHLLDYPRCCYTNGCGSMKHVEDNIIDLGINYNKIPPHSQSLNSAERIAD